MSHPLSLSLSLFYFFLAVILRSCFFLKAYHHLYASSLERQNPSAPEETLRSFTMEMTAL